MTAQDSWPLIYRLPPVDHGTQSLDAWLAHNELTGPRPSPRSYPPISRSESMGVGLPLNPTETTHANAFKSQS